MKGAIAKALEIKEKESNTFMPDQFGNPANPKAHRETTAVGRRNGHLAVLFAGLDLVDALQPQLDDMAQRCFKWVCRRQQVKIDDWHARLVMLKNTAYAWRQMIFFLALLPQENVTAFISWANEHLSKQRAEFQTRFFPAMKGLALAARSQSIDAEPGARRFQGWSKERHWLLD